MRHHRLALGAAAIGALLPVAPAQFKKPPQEVLIARRAAERAKPVFHQAKWEMDYDRARAIAEEQGKSLLVYFTRSYAG